MNELYQFLNSISPISPETWQKIKELQSEITLKKGEYFVKDGETAHQIGFLRSGIIRAFYRNDKGLEYNKHFFISNSFVAGYSSLITNLPSKISKQALTDCLLIVSNYDDICKLYNNHQDFERIGRRLAELFFVQKEQREIEIVMLEAEERYCNFQKQWICK